MHNMRRLEEPMEPMGTVAKMFWRMTYGVPKTRWQRFKDKVQELIKLIFN